VGRGEGLVEVGGGVFEGRVGGMGGGIGVRLVATATTTTADTTVSIIIVDIIHISILISIAITSTIPILITISILLHQQIKHHPHPLHNRPLHTHIILTPSSQLPTFRGQLSPPVADRELLLQEGWIDLCVMPGDEVLVERGPVLVQQEEGLLGGARMGGEVLGVELVEQVLEEPMGEQGSPGVGGVDVCWAIGWSLITT